MTRKKTEAVTQDQVSWGTDIFWNIFGQPETWTHKTSQYKLPPLNLTVSLSILSVLLDS